MSERAAAASAARPRAQIVGLGLIGSSVGMALRAAGYHVTGRDLDGARAARAAELGAVDATGEDPAAVVAFVATPVATIPGIVAELFSSSVNPALVVTDVGSVKGTVVAGVSAGRFVGGHPMAGSEQEGPDGADATLFSGATWVLTPSAATEEEAFEVVRELVSSFGADAVVLEAARHDALVAVVSHVPHLTAATLMAVAADASEEHAALLRLAAGGFRDMTRIAGGDPAIWPDIFADNREAVLSVLDALRERLDVARALVARGARTELIALLEYAKAARRNLPPRVLPPEHLSECRVPIPDRPGALAEVTGTLSDLGLNIWDIEIAHSAEGERGVLVLTIDASGADKARAALVERGFRPALAALA
ncbi:MAG TPA: prephenate dehydrogenase [Acidimicrobiales bacterium]|nr:prephenate dehydrogenase [Acidimicrobiales bacterium]